jgi:L-aspartate oxidase
VIQEEISNFYWQHPLSRDLIELRNLSLIAELIVRSAQQRHESRGLHYSTDYPSSKEPGKDTLLSPQ